MAYWKLSDGSMVGMELPWVCSASSFDNIPEDYIPYLKWYTDETASDGLAYKTARAYDSPISKFKFLGASVKRTDRKAYKQWRKQNNIHQICTSKVSRAALIGAFETLPPKGKTKKSCASTDPKYLMKHLRRFYAKGYTRLPMPPGMLEYALRHWPKEAGRYLVLSSLLHPDDTEYQQFYKEIRKRYNEGVYYGEYGWRNFFTGGPRETIGPGGVGVSNSDKMRAYGTRWTEADYFQLPDMFPIFPYSQSMENTHDPQSVYVRHLMTTPEYNGFRAITLKTGINSMLDGPSDAEPFDPEFFKKQHLILIDGEAAYPNLIRPSVGIKQKVAVPGFILDRDGFIFF